MCFPGNYQNYIVILDLHIEHQLMCFAMLVIVTSRLWLKWEFWEQKLNIINFIIRGVLLLGLISMSYHCKTFNYAYINK